MQMHVLEDWALTWKPDLYDRQLKDLLFLASVEIQGEMPL